MINLHEKAKEGKILEKKPKKYVDAFETLKGKKMKHKGKNVEPYQISDYFIGTSKETIR